MSTTHNILELQNGSTITIDSHSRSSLLELDIDVPLDRDFISLELTPEQLFGVANRLKEVAENYLPTYVCICGHEDKLPNYIVHENEEPGTSTLLATCPKCSKLEPIKPKEYNA